MDNNRWYKPREIATLGLIKSSGRGDSVGGNYAHIMKLIKSGKLKSKNYCTTGKQYYLVKGREISRYQNSYDKVTP